MTLPNKAGGELGNQAATMAKFFREKYGEQWVNKLTKEENAAYDNLISMQENAEKGNIYKSSHWDEPNVLAHIRTNDRTIEGQKALHIEEIQSDWHQQGRKQGYRDNEAINKAKNDLDLATEEWKRTQSNEALAKIDEANKKFQDLNSSAGAIPTAPFKKSWDELALKRMIQHAAKNDYDAISWTPGEAQAARYDLSKQVNSIRWDAAKNSNLQNSKSILIDTKSGPARFNINDKGVIHGTAESGVTDQAWLGKHLSDVVGKDIADKIINGQNGELKGEGLKVGGEGMKAFYDKMLVDKANAIAKKYGGKVETNKLIPKHNELPSHLYEYQIQKHLISNPDEALPIHYLKLTPELKKKALEEGFPLFASSPVLTKVEGNPFEDKKKYKLTKVDHNPFIPNHIVPPTRIYKSRANNKE